MPGGCSGCLWYSECCRGALSPNGGATVAEVCFHACWLRHASNEAHHQPDAPSARPFGSILRTVVDHAERFATPLYRSR